MVSTAGKVLLCLTLAGCDVGLDGRRCEDANYMTAWGVCVYTSPTGQFPKEDVEKTLGWFVAGLKHYGVVNDDYINNYWRSSNTSLTFTNEQLWADNDAFELDGYSARRYSPFATLISVYVRVSEQTDSSFFGATTHELLHTVQYYLDVYDDDYSHRYPTDWFHDYDQTTGDFYPDTEHHEKLEDTLYYYIYCHSLGVETGWCEEYQ